jgi:hypothetical protein
MVTTVIFFSGGIGQPLGRVTRALECVDSSNQRRWKRKRLRPMAGVFIAHFVGRGGWSHVMIPSYVKIGTNIALR